MATARGARDQRRIRAVAFSMALPNSFRKILNAPCPIRDRALLGRARGNDRGFLGGFSDGALARCGYAI